MCLISLYNTQENVLHSRKPLNYQNMLCSKYLGGNGIVVHKGAHQKTSVLQNLKSQVFAFQFREQSFTKKLQSSELAINYVLHCTCLHRYLSAPSLHLSPRSVHLLCPSLVRSRRCRVTLCAICFSSEKWHAGLVACRCAKLNCLFGQRVLNTCCGSGLWGWTWIQLNPRPLWASSQAEAEESCVFWWRGLPGRPTQGTGGGWADSGGRESVWWARRSVLGRRISMCRDADIWKSRLRFGKNGDLVEKLWIWGSVPPEFKTLPRCSVAVWSWGWH